MMLIMYFKLNLYWVFILFTVCLYDMLGQVVYLFGGFFQQTPPSLPPKRGGGGMIRVRGAGFSNFVVQKKQCVASAKCDSEQGLQCELLCPTADERSLRTQNLKMRTDITAHMHLCMLISMFLQTFSRYVFHLTAKQAYLCVCKKQPGDRRL